MMDASISLHGFSKEYFIYLFWTNIFVKIWQ